jgi:hypothetical protein
MPSFTVAGLDVHTSLFCQPAGTVLNAVLIIIELVAESYYTYSISNRCTRSVVLQCLGLHAVVVWHEEDNNDKDEHACLHSAPNVYLRIKLCRTAAVVHLK